MAVFWCSSSCGGLAESFLNRDSDRYDQLCYQGLQLITVAVPIIRGVGIHYYRNSYGHVCSFLISPRIYQAPLKPLLES